MTPFLLYGLVAGSTYALLAVGFGLVYFTTGIFHFAHGAVYALAGYAFWLAYQGHGWPLAPAVALGLLVAMAAGWLVEVGLYRPLRRRRAPTDVLFLTSLGVYTVISNALALGFGHDAQPLTRLPNPGFVIREAQGAGAAPLILTRMQIVTLVTAALAFVATAALLKWTPFGLATRAYAANPELADAIGLESRRLLPGVAVFGSALAAVAAMCVAADVGVTPEMGLAAVVTGAVAVVVGGVGSLPGTALGGLLLGLLQHLTRFKLEARWEETITFGILLIVLLVRPRGLFGKPADG